MVSLSNHYVNDVATTRLRMTDEFVKQVVLIGSGKRVKGVILPALECLQDEFRIVGIISKTEKELNLFGGGASFAVRTQTSYDSIDWHLINVVIIAVTLEAVPLVIRELEARGTRHITLMIDTPVLPLRQLGAIKLLKQFKRVQVSEDTLGLPPFVAARKIIDQDSIGKLKHIWFFHSGYRYHAVACLKWLTRSSYVRYARMKKWNRGAGVKELKLSSGTSATIVEPRDYSVGRFLIVGEKGSIADYPIEKVENHYVVENDDMTQMKIQGFVAVLKNLEDPDSPYRYAPADGLYDAAVIACLEKTGCFFDCKVTRRSLVSRMLSFISTFL